MANDEVVGAPRTGMTQIPVEWQSREQALAMLGTSEDEFRDLINESSHRNLVLLLDHREN